MISRMARSLLNKPNVQVRNKEPSMIEPHTFSTVVEDVEIIWNVSDLIAQGDKLPTTQWEIPESFLDQWCWGEDHPSDHVIPCLRADLSKPILVWDGVVVDGCHRISLALAQGKTHLPAKVIVNMPPPEDSKEVSGTRVQSKWTFRDVVKIVASVGGYIDQMEMYKGNHPLDF